MKCEILTTYGTWRDVADACRTTIGKEAGIGEPSSKWKKTILLAEHSPIRLLQIKARWTDLPYWVSVHFVRHKIGIEHWVKSQRQDKTGIIRNSLTQDALITHEFLANAQAIINISRKRLCNNASKETRQAWELFLVELKKIQPELATSCRSECVYRGFCPEFKSCNYYKNLELENLYYYRYPEVPGIDIFQKVTELSQCNKFF